MCRFAPWQDPCQCILDVRQDLLGKYVMFLGWADFSSVNTWTTNFLPPTIKTLVSPPVDVFKVAAMNVKPEIPQRNNAKDAITVPIFKSMMMEHATFLGLVKLKHQAGRVLTREASLRHQPALFGKFALIAVLFCSGSDITGVVTKCATDLAQGKRKFGKFNLLHYN